MDKEISTCAECESDFFSDSSKMIELCPECAHLLYGYRNCEHEFKENRCSKCYWNGNVSNYLKNK